MNRVIRFAFQQFYTTFAWTYDAVAHAVSFGEWKAWGRAAIPFLPQDGRVLEIAHGPGHLHLALRQQGYDVAGMDLSPQMGGIMRSRVMGTTGQSPLQVRASALRLPFADGAFVGAVSTFPAGFIFQHDTLNDVRRVLRAGGRFVIVPGATLRKDGLSAEAVRLAYRVTGQGEMRTDAVGLLFDQAGFTFETHIVQTRRANVTVWVCGREE